MNAIIMSKASSAPANATSSSPKSHYSRSDNAVLISRLHHLYEGRAFRTCRPSFFFRLQTLQFRPRRCSFSLPTSFLHCVFLSAVLGLGLLVRSMSRSVAHGTIEGGLWSRVRRAAILDCILGPQGSRCFFCSSGVLFKLALRGRFSIEERLKNPVNPCSEVFSINTGAVGYPRPILDVSTSSHVNVRCA